MPTSKAPVGGKRNQFVAQEILLLDGAMTLLHQASILVSALAGGTLIVTGMLELRQQRATVGVLRERVVESCLDLGNCPLGMFGDEGVFTLRGGFQGGERDFGAAKRMDEEEAVPDESGRPPGICL